MQDKANPPNFEELGERAYTAHNTFKGGFALLSNRYTMIQLRASIESDATVHGGAEALRAKWLNAHYVKSRCKMEILKKLRRLAKPDDWCFSFDLQDGYHAVRIDPEYQEYMQFDVRGELFQCGALPFGWNDSPRIFVKIMKVLVECLRSPRSGADRWEMRKLQSGRKMWFQQLEAVANELVILPRGRDLFTPGRLGGSELLGASKWDGLMFRISASRHASAVHEHGLGMQPVGQAETGLLRACAYVVFAFVTFGRPDTGVSMQRQHINITGDTASVVPHKEKGRRHVRLKRRLTVPADGVRGLVPLLQHWEQLSSAIHSYIDPTAVPDEYMERYFG
eukprot:gene15972-biopygen16470